MTKLGDTVSKINTNMI